MILMRSGQLSQLRTTAPCVMKASQSRISLLQSAWPQTGARERSLSWCHWLMLQRRCIKIYLTAKELEVCKGEVELGDMMPVDCTWGRLQRPLVKHQASPCVPWKVGLRRP